MLFFIFIHYHLTTQNRNNVKLAKFILVCIYQLRRKDYYQLKNLHIIQKFVSQIDPYLTILTCCVSIVLLGNTLYALKLVFVALSQYIQYFTGLISFTDLRLEVNTDKNEEFDIECVKSTQLGQTPFKQLNHLISSCLC